MKIDLSTLLDNPMRDFTIDPIDQEAVARLHNSIHTHGFWGGVVVAKIGGHHYIVCGHTRVRAALASGLTHADLYVIDEPDPFTIGHIYAVENATQRGSSNTAIAGSIAAVIKIVARCIITGEQHLSQIWETPKALETLRGQLVTDRGLGQPIVERFLLDVPGMHKHVIGEQLANLKASGDYHRIIHTVSAEIEDENAEAMEKVKELEAQAEKARQQSVLKAKESLRIQEQAEKERARAEAALSEKRALQIEEELKGFDTQRVSSETAHKAGAATLDPDITFDFAGVSRHLVNDSHVREFRKLVNAAGIQPLLPVDQQAALAKEIVRLAKSQDAELTARFIRDNVTNLVINAKHHQRKLTEEERKGLEAEDVRIKFDNLCDAFLAHVQGLIRTGGSMLDLFRTHRTTSFNFPSNFKTVLRAAEQITIQLSKKL